MTSPVNREEIEGRLRWVAGECENGDTVLLAASVAKQHGADLTALLAENERLRGALREARPIVGDRAVGGRMITPPAEAGRVLAAIIAALNKDPDQ